MKPTKEQIRNILANATAVWAVGDFETRMYHNINNLQKW